MAGGRNENIVIVRSVIDGGDRPMEDDGYHEGDPKKPGSKRARIEQMLEYEDEHGDPIFFCLEKPKQWQVPHSPGVMMEGIRTHQIWGKEQDKKLAASLKKRAAERQDALDSYTARVSTGLGAAVEKADERDETADAMRGLAIADNAGKS